MDAVFLDSNAVIDFLGERRPYYEFIAKTLSLADQKKIKIFVSPISFAAAYYIISKFESKKKVMDKIRKFKILVQTASISDNSLEKAINSDFSDFEDALQYFSAIDAKCNLILTRNEKDFKAAMIPVMSPENYLKLRLTL